MRRIVAAILCTAAVAFAQKPLKFLPCMMCEILDDDASPKVLSYFADYQGVEYAFDTEAHREAFLRDANVWLTWHDEPVPEPDGHATLVPS